MKIHSYLGLIALGLPFSTACSEKNTPEVEVKNTEAHGAADVKDVRFTKFAFGSCSKQFLPQPLWKNIIADKPQLFLWTGDTVYADTEDMGKLSQIYASELKQPEYAAFLASGIPVIGVWDDHDYGEGDGDGDYKPKRQSQKLFLDFLGEPQDSLRRKQEGVYASYTFGQGQSSARIVMMDTRYFRDEKHDDMLGELQWQWLERELSADRGAVTFLVSSVQFLNSEQKFDKWEDTPKSRQRLLNIIDKSPIKNLIVISGDRHFAELSKLRLPSGKDLWDITSSGMTHSFKNPDDLRNHNSLRVGPILDRLNYGLIQIDYQKKTVEIQAKDLNRSAIIDQTIQLK